jgi:Ca2+-binding RTX toxin-like protein
LPNRFLLSLEVSATYGSAAPTLEILVGGVVVSSSTVLSHTGLGTDFFEYSLDFTGNSPASLSFRFNDGSPEGGRNISFAHVYVNGQEINAAYLSQLLVTQGQSNAVTVASVAYLFGRTEPVTADLGAATITGTAAANTLNGTTGDDVISGLAGNDRIDGKAGNDKITGGVNDDTLYGGLGKDLLMGDLGNDRLFGNDGNDLLYGNDGNDIMDGGAGNDVLSGGNNNDTMLGGAGNDVLYGGAGIDTLSGDLGDDYLYGDDGIDLMAGGVGNDVMYGGLGTDSMDGAAGNDAMYGEGDDDMMSGAAGDDTMDGGSGNDQINGGTGADSLAGGAGDDIIQGDVGNDTLNGDADNDVLIGGSGNDTITGGDGDDRLYGHALTSAAAAAILSANPGVVYDAASNSFYKLVTGTATLAAAQAAAAATTLSGVAGHLATITSAAENARVLAVAAGNTVWLGGSDAGAEGVWTWGAGYENGLQFWSGAAAGSAVNGFYTNWAAGEPNDAGNADGMTMGAAGTWSDQAVGGAFAYVIEWDAISFSDDSGTDNLSGGNGNDMLWGGAGADILAGDANDDKIYGGAGNDTITGGDGNDILTGNAGTDNINGGNGTDMVNYITAASSGVTVNLNPGVNNVSNDGDGSTDTISFIENVNGSNFNDSITGDGNANVIYGNGGNDGITGGAGADTLYGGDGNDTFSLANGDFAAGETIDGGANTTSDAIVLTNATTVNFTTGTLSGLETLTGSTSNDTVTLSASQLGMLTSADFSGGAADRLNVAVSGVMNIAAMTTTISNLENGYLVGSAGADTLTITGTLLDYIISGTGTIDFSGGSDTLNITGTSADLNTLGATNASITNLEAISAATAAAGVTISLYNQTEAFAITGSGSNDTIEGGAAADTLNGGGGTGDTVTYANATSFVTVNLQTGMVTGGGGADTISNFENVTGSAFNDTLTGSTGANTLTGGNGNDTIDGGDGNIADTLDGGGGADTLTYAALTGGTGVNVNLTSGIVAGGAGADTASNFENLIGSAYDDTLTGNIADNIIEGGAGNDTMNGVSGTDTLTYANAAGGITISLAVAGAQATGGAGTDTISNFDNLTGSVFDDVLTGNANANTVDGGYGDDVIEGGSGNDTLTGGGDTDRLTYQNAAAGITISLASGAAQNTGGAGTDTISGFEDLTGSAFNDSLTGDGNDNVIEGLGGDDTMVGGLGTDTVTYALAASAITVSLAITAAQNTVGAGTDTISGFEDLTGSAFNDKLTGDANANTILGSNGNDIIQGMGGNDILTGGAGSDTATYVNAASAVTVSLATLTAQNTLGAGSDTLSGFENLTGSGFNDTLTGDGSANVIAGGVGSDTINGGAGNDTLYAVMPVVTLISTTFNAGLESFAYADNAFGGSGGAYVDGARTTTDGSGGNGALQIVFDGTNATASGTMSGGFSRGFTATDAVENTILEFDYRVIREGTYETTEDGYVYVAIDGINYGVGVNDYISKFESDGNDPQYDTGWVHITLDLGTLAAGAHTITVGGLVEGKNAADEDTTIRFDNIVIASNVPDDDGESNVLDGGNNDDTIYGSAGTDALNGGSGNDTIYSGSTQTISSADVLAAYAGVVYNATTNSFYQFVNSSVTWQAAQTAATASLIFGVAGHLVHSNSAVENAYIDTISGANDIHMGGSDGLVNGEWRWVGGGEDGVQFWQGLAGGSAVGGAYNNWNAGEPNDYNGYESRMMMYNGGLWNDQLEGTAARYVIEWEADDILVTGNTTTINAGDGNDTVNGGAGTDIVDGGAGNDSLVGAGGTDTLVYTSATSGVTVSLAVGAAQVTGGAGTDTISGFENLTGSAFGDTLTGDTGANVIDGGGGNDTIEGGTGDDTLAGGLGTDTLSYANAASLVTVNLQTGAVSGGAGNDTVSGFENLTGSTFNDTLTGSTSANVITGGNGNDTIDGGDGNIADTLNGGGGTDTLTYAVLTGGSGVTASLTAGTVSGGAGADVISGFENLTGSQYADTLTGDGNANTITGGGGADTLYGMGGNDSLVSGSVDTLTAQVNAILAANPGVVYNATTGSFYQFVDSGSGVNWATAKAAATAATINGVAGHLVQVTSSAENSIIDTLSGGRNIWMGGTDEGGEGVWRWLGGPMDGIQFWQGDDTGSTRNGFYENWDSGDPDTSNADDDALRMTNGGDWEDARIGTSNRYVIEWEGSQLLTPTESVTLSGGAGTDILTGGAGQDIFVIDASSWGTNDTINGYNKAHLDKIDISGLLSGYTAGVSDNDAFARLTVSGGNLLLQVDQNGTTGGSSYTTVATLAGLGTSGLNIEEMVANDLLIMVPLVPPTMTFNFDWGTGSYLHTSDTLGTQTFDNGDIGYGGASGDMFEVQRTMTTARLGYLHANAPGTVTITGSTSGDTLTVEGIVSSLAATINMGDGNDTVTVTTAGNSVINGQNGDDALAGGDGNDTITGGADIDTMNGGNGNDTFNLANNDFGAGESIDGGAGTNTILLTNATTIDLSAGTIANIANFTGSSGNDTVTMSAAHFSGFGTINLAGGTNVMNVVASGDISGLSATTVQNVGTGNLIGTGGDDSITLTGAQLNSIIQGAGTIDLGGGADTITLTSDSADLDSLAATDAGIQGVEYWSFATATASITLDMSAQSETLLIAGGTANDTIEGGTGTNVIVGGDGNDTVISNSVDSLAAQIAAIEAMGVTYNATTGSFYLFVNTTSSWTAANTAAQGYGFDGHLVHITSAAENAYVDALAGNNSIWIGLSDRSDEDDWAFEGGPMDGISVWDDNSSSSQNGMYENWAAGQPDDGPGTQDYAAMANGGQWSDETNTGTNRRYVVEWEGMNVMTPSSSTYLSGGAGDDTLYGGAGNDIFLFEAATAGTNDTIYNYNHTHLDKLDISDLLTGYNPGTSDNDAFARFVTSGADLLLQVDANGTTGGSSFSTVGTLVGLGSSGLNVEEMVATGLLIMT